MKTPTSESGREGGREREREREREEEGERERRKDDYFAALCYEAHKEELIHLRVPLCLTNRWHHQLSSVFIYLTNSPFGKHVYHLHWVSSLGR
jgi:hypothetical protein